jgi:superfamily I DNA/RNA helicase
LISPCRPCRPTANSWLPLRLLHSLRVTDLEAKIAVLSASSILFATASALLAIRRLRKTDKTAKVDDLLAAIDALFGDNVKDAVTFSTIHKSKGREWGRVVWLETGPSPWARKAWEQQQEANLCYVAATRAKAELVLIPAK